MAVKMDSSVPEILLGQTRAKKCRDRSLLQHLGSLSGEKAFQIDTLQRLNLRSLGALRLKSHTLTPDRVDLPS